MARRGDLLDIALLIIGGLLTLLLGGEALVRGGVGLARHWHVPPLLIGLTIVSIGTSAPELAVGLLATSQGQSDIALGNVVGSNICNIGLILGLLSLLRPLHVERRLVVREAPILLGVTAVVLVFLVDREVSRVEGGLLLIGLVLYLSLAFRGGHRMELAEGALPGRRQGDFPLRDLGSLLFGVVALTVGGDWLVDGAVAVAEGMGVSPAIIGVTIIAIGTSLPELVASLMALRSGEADLAIGNVMGSNLFNLMGILGAASASYGVRMMSLEWTDLIFMSVLTLVLVPMVVSARKLVRWEGASLLLAYMGYLAWLTLS